MLFCLLLHVVKTLLHCFLIFYYQIDLRYSSMSGRGYEMKILFAGLYIADVSWDFNVISLICTSVVKAPQIDTIWSVSK